MAALLFLIICLLAVGLWFVAWKTLFSYLKDLKQGALWRLRDQLTDDMRSQVVPTSNAATELRDLIQLAAENASSLGAANTFLLYITGNKDKNYTWPGANEPQLAKYITEFEDVLTTTFPMKMVPRQWTLESSSYFLEHNEIFKGLATA